MSHLSIHKIKKRGSIKRQAVKIDQLNCRMFLFGPSQKLFTDIETSPIAGEVQKIFYLCSVIMAIDQ